MRSAPINNGVSQPDSLSPSFSGDSGKVSTIELTKPLGPIRKMECIPEASYGTMVFSVSKRDDSS